jgi:hypothetical protein
VKHHQKSRDRLGFGQSGSSGFQPEIVSRKPTYFESNLHWAIASEVHPEKGIIFVSSDIVRKYVSGGKVGQKLNNIQVKIFREITELNEKGFVSELSQWLTPTQQFKDALLKERFVQSFKRPGV